MGLLSAIYSTALSGRKLVYSSGLKKPKKLPVKVISIGNLTLGGTGKTPAVIALAQEAKKRGFKPCVLTRGYKGRAKGPCFVSKGESPLLTTYQAGDEPVLMAERLEGVPVVIGKHRYNSGIFAIDKFTPRPLDMFILDDGFQHWALYRDMDILLIDASNPFGNGKLFPEGILREPLKVLSRSHIVVITKVNMVCGEVIKAVVQKVKENKPDAVVYTSYHKATELISLSGEVKDLEMLRNSSVHAFTAIANPKYFKNLLTSIGADIINFKPFRDHHVYSQSEINTIAMETSGLKIITTEKDLVKLRELELPENIYALRVEFSIDDSFYDHIFDILLKKMS